MKTVKLFIIISLLSLYANAQKRIDFTLKSVTDNSTFTLRKAKGKLVALHFLLKTECPYCIKHTNDYFEKAASLPDVIQVFIKPDDEKDIQQWANKLKTSENGKFPIYQDANAAVADLYNVPSGYFFHGQTVHYPALILLNEKGVEIFRYVGKNNSNRFSFENLKNKVEELKAGK